MIITGIIDRYFYAIIFFTLVASAIVQMTIGVEVKVVTGKGYKYGIIWH